MHSIQLREPAAARAGGYTLALAGLLVAIGLSLHPVPAGGFGSAGRHIRLSADTSAGSLGTPYARGE
ncbi:MAG: hypothetical protein ACREOG_08690 [Gemmatimonadaceae bacterium]